MVRVIFLVLLNCSLLSRTYCQSLAVADTVIFESGNLRLKGLFWKPFGVTKPAVILFNHGSELYPHRFIDEIAGPLVKEGYAFFLPCRRGQGLSAGQGQNIRVALDSAEKIGGIDARSALLIRLHETTQLQDQLAALRYLNSRKDIDTTKIVVAGVSFGGIQSMLIAKERTNVKAVINFAGAAMNWEKSEAVANWMKQVATAAVKPVYLVQAENDFSIKPSIELNDVMMKANKTVRMKIYPPQGTKPMDGHSLAYNPAVWMPDVLPQLEQWIKKK